MIATATEQDLIPLGVHRSLPFVDYCLDPGVNASTLKLFGITPKHAKHAMDQPEEDTGSSIIGHGSHTAVLEPDQYGDLYAVYPKADMIAEHGHPNSNKYKAAKLAWYAEHDGACIIDDAQDQIARGVLEAVRGHKLARELLIDGKGRNELTVIGDLDGTRTKARIDRLTTYLSHPAIVDLKTIASKGRPLEPSYVERQIHTYRYHQQLAWYDDRLNDHAPADRLKLIVFVENTPPHDVVCYEVSDEAIEQGRRDNARALKQLLRGRRDGVWPGYSNQLLSASLPKYAFDGDMS